MDGNIGGQASSMFAVGGATYRLVVAGTPKTIVHNDGPIGEFVQSFQCVNESMVEPELAATVAGKLNSRKMLAQVAASDGLDSL